MGRENAKRHLAKRTEQEQWDFFAEYERLILQGAGVDVPAKLAGEIFQAIRAIPYHLALYDDALPCIETLKASGFTVGMISNIYSDLKRTCDRLGLSSRLDFWVTSKEAGSEKPHPGIFRLALQKAGVEARDSVHVGDQYYSDVTGARGAGITPRADRPHRPIGSAGLRHGAHPVGSAGAAAIGVRTSAPGRLLG